MNRSGTVEYALQDLEPSDEPLLRRRSDGDIIHANQHLTILSWTTNRANETLETAPSPPRTLRAPLKSTENNVESRRPTNSFGALGGSSLPSLACSLLFLCAAISLAVMMLYSKKNHGLCETRSDLEYVWRFAPTAVLTIVAGFWSRTTFQAARYMPWIELQHAKSIENIDFLLDYTSMTRPTVLFQSLRRKHFLVFSITVVSILLKIQIVLASGLYRAGDASVWGGTELRLLDVFNASAWEGTPPPRLSDDPVYGEFGIRLETDCSAYSIPRAIHDFSKLPPFGAAAEAAYQTFEPRGSSAAPVSVIVDGFFTDIHCSKLESYSVTAVRAHREDSGYESLSFQMSLNFPHCSNVSYVTSPLFFAEMTVWELKRAASPCKSLPGGRRIQQLVYSAIAFENSSNDSWAPTIASVSAVIFDIWSQFHDTNQERLSLNNTETLYNVMADVTKQLGPFLAHFNFRRQKTTQREGRTQSHVHRLTTGLWVGVCMLLIFTLMFSIVLLTAAQPVPEQTKYQLQQIDSFGDKEFNSSHMEDYAINRALLGSLLLRSKEGSLVYPKNTFGSLAFPLVDAGDMPSTSKVARNITVEALMPAATLVSKCKKLTVTKGEEWNWTRASETPTLISRHSWVCDHSWARIMVTVSMVMVDGELTIDQTNPPRPDNSTLQSWNPPLSLPYIDYNDPRVLVGIIPANSQTLPNLTPEVMAANEISLGFMEDSFKILIQPWGDIPIEDFVDPEKDGNIIKALTHNRAVLSAQLLNIENRFSLEEAPHAEALPPIEAVLIDHDKKRIVQSPTATYLLLAILGFVATTHIAMLLSTFLRRCLGPRKWLLHMDVKGLAPDGFNSIGMMAALLRPSNAMQYMPSQVLSQAETYEQLRGLRFRMGWFRRESDRTRHFTIGVLGDENFTFLGGKNDMDAEGLEKKDESV
ncbi:hypothetical protein CPLU01_05037 [Colletotrichum plurivorum]|uniref:Uncharacterized protein n=1 Tax=Colletotrichum plurivorum TaxID=2175906 RepID=A0A8H6NIZ3_9PEZI|nr:hypothetical protein CPLU01_05037 [Colletotrichum plurivorum]